MARPQALLAIDVGSTSTRVTAVGLDGGALRSRALPTPVASPGPGRAELDFDDLWPPLTAASRSLELGELEVVGVGVSALMSTACLGEAGEPVGPALLWSDSRAVEELDEGAAAVTLELARRPPSAELWGPRLRWLRRHEPERLRATAQLGSLKDAIVARLSGAVATDPTHASFSGALDVAAREWSPRLLAAWGIEPQLLPTLRDPAAVAGELLAAPAAELGLAPGAPVAVGGPDGSVGALGAGGTAAGITVDVAGTSDVISHLVAAPVADPHGATVLNAFPLAGLWGLGGPTGSTGGTVEWAARLLGFESAAAAVAALGPELDAIGPGAGGVVFRPHLSGSRFPGWAPGETGAITGLRPGHGPAHLLAAALEGSAFAVRAGLEAIRDCGREPEELVVAGGLAADPRALRLRADATGLPVLAPRQREVTTAGAAMLAGLAAGVFGSPAEAAAALGSEATRVEPGPPAPALEQAYAAWRAAGAQAES